MDTKELCSAIGNFGFPMVLSWYLLLRMEQRLDKLTNCLNELSKAILQNNRIEKWYKEKSRSYL